jgi:hypothetical protein
MAAGSDACASAAAVAAGESSDEVMFMQLLEWSGTGGTFAVSSPLTADGSDGSTDVFVMPYVAELGGLIPLESGSVILGAASEGEDLDVSALSASNEFGDSAEGSFSACWCDALDGIDVSSAGEEEPPPPPVASGAPSLGEWTYAAWMAPSIWRTPDALDWRGMTAAVD